ncbi:hypothetical protein MSAN_01188300 [Mycena sanguinolenta]|uniref:DUF6533 domain-containing protein n=1 Tax=Mycena sanguinolenta TaxID=230812 RepID=A0A8H6YM37_9AGAR|nr:hypothetical protein MSAN_01188300 [Mycena sanguinolenta]
MSEDDSIYAPAMRLQLVKYFCAASLTLQGYDWLTCLEREVETVWGSPWKGAKILYLLSRYLPLVNLSSALYYYVVFEPTVSTCERVDALAGWLTAIGIVVSEGMLIMRTYAIFNSSKKILIFLLVLLAILVGIAFPTAELFIRSLRYGQPPVGAINGCFPVSGSAIIFVSFVAILLFETTIVALTIYSAFRHLRRDSSPMIKVLYRDSLFFFLCIFFITLGNVLVPALASSQYADLLNRLQVAVHSIVSTRIIFHLREQSHVHIDTWEMSRATAVSVSMNFGSNDTSSLQVEHRESHEFELGQIGIAV